MYKIKHNKKVTVVESARSVMRILNRLVVKMKSGERVVITYRQPRKRARQKHSPPFHSPTAD